MKKIFYFLWSFISLAFIFLFIIFLLLNYEIPIKILIILPILLSFLIIILARNKIFPLANHLLKLYLSIFSGIFLSIIIFFIFPKTKQVFLGIIIIGGFILGLVLNYIISFKKTIKGVYFFLALFFAGIFLSFIISEMQKGVLRKYEKKLKDVGFSFELKEIFPYDYSKPQCEALFEKMKIFSDEKNEKWNSFYNNYVIPYHEEKFQKFLKEGKNPVEEILSNEKINEKIWEEFFILNEEIKKELLKCPHFQWFNPVEEILSNEKINEKIWEEFFISNEEITKKLLKCPHFQWSKPEEYKDKLWARPIPPLLSLMKFSRTLQTASIILKAKGKEKEADEMLKELYELKEKLKIKGMPLISNLISIAMERVYLIGEAFLISISGNLSPDKIERIEKISKDDFSTLLSSFNVEFYTFISYHKNPKFTEILTLYGPIKDDIILKYIPKFILRAFLYTETKNYLYNVFQSFVNLKKAIAEESKFDLKDFKNIKLKPSYFYEDLSSAYVRNLTVVAQARALLLSDEILKYYEKNKNLPESIESIKNLNSIDPFSKKNLIYKKIDEKKFLIYSVGWDGKDDGGKKLYVSGALKLDEEGRDIGFCFKKIY